MNWPSRNLINIFTLLRASLINKYLYVCMLAIAGQTAGPNIPKFFEKTQGYPGGNCNIG